MLSKSNLQVTITISLGKVEEETACELLSRSNKQGTETLSLSEKEEEEVYG